jgi:molecular chaperone Hsp33
MNAIHPTPEDGRPTGPEDDMILPFAVEDLDVRGRVAHMGSVLDEILTQHAYPEPVSRLLGEAVVLTGLLATALKLDGRFILQMQGDGPVSLVVVDFRSPNGVRGYARFDADALAEREGGADGDAGVTALVGRGHMALTVDPGATMRRYQGIVPLDGGSLEEVAQAYFDQSEQIPTLIRLAVAETLERQPGEAPRKRWRGGGISVQFLPERPERIVKRDLDPGDAPAGQPRDERPDDDAWVEARMRTETVEDHELIDPDVTPARLLVRLFNQRDVRVFDAIPLEQKCHCSRERIRGILGQFPEGEREGMVEDGAIVVTCEFCNRVYRFDPGEV